MPTRCSIRLRVQREGPARPRHLRSFVSSLIEPDDLHRTNVKEFTVAPPVERDGYLDIPLTLLTERAERQLDRSLSSWSRAGGSRKIGATVVEVGEPPIADVSHRSWHALLEDTVEEPTVTLRFLTPTVFLNQRQQSPWPQPSTVFGGYRGRWNKLRQLAGAADQPGGHPECDLAFDDLGLAVVAFDGCSGEWVDGRRQHGKIVDKRYVGFVGDVTYEATGKAVARAQLRWLHALASFAEYCGTGANTTIGMGQTRYLGC